MGFEFATATRIIFGEGTASTLPELARSFGFRPMVVTGASTERVEPLVSVLSAETFTVPGEPTVELVRAESVLDGAFVPRTRINWNSVPSSWTVSL